MLIVRAIRRRVTVEGLALLPDVLFRWARAQYIRHRRAVLMLLRVKSVLIVTRLVVIEDACAVDGRVVHGPAVVEVREKVGAGVGGRPVVFAHGVAELGDVGRVVRGSLVGSWELGWAWGRREVGHWIMLLLRWAGQFLGCHVEIEIVHLCRHA